MISKSVNRARPFISDGATNFLNHSNDGGMPSHHMVFTIALAFCVIGFHRNIGVIILIMALISFNFVYADDFTDAVLKAKKKLKESENSNDQSKLLKVRGDFERILQ